MDFELMRETGNVGTFPWDLTCLLEVMLVQDDLILVAGCAIARHVLIERRLRLS